MMNRKLKLGEKEAAESKIITKGNRTLDDLQKLVKRVGASEIAKTLTEDEFKSLVMREPTLKAEKKVKEDLHKALKELVLEYLRINNERKVEVNGLWAEVSDTRSFKVEPLAVALYLLTYRLDDDQIERIAAILAECGTYSKKQAKEDFNSLFTVNLTNARSRLGERCLMEHCGGDYETKEFASVSIK